MAFKNFVYTNEIQATAMTGEIKSDPTTLSLDKLHAELGHGGNASLNARLSFDGKAQAPYVLQGDLTVANLSSGPWLALFSPIHEPAVEGRFDMVGKISGQSAELDALTNALSTDLKLTSRGGKFRGFAAGASTAELLKYQKAASTLGNLLQTAAGMVGYQASTSADRIRAAIDAMNRFVEIDFDQLNLELIHQPDSATKISDFSLMSPQIRFTGEGSIDASADLAWYDQPLHLDLAIAVRGQQASDLKKLGLLKDEKDSLGYTPLQDNIVLEGSLAHLTAAQLNRLLTRILPRSP